MATLTPEQEQELRDELERIQDSLRKKPAKRKGYTTKERRAGELFRILKDKFLNDPRPYCDQSVLRLKPDKAHWYKFSLTRHLRRGGPYYNGIWPTISVRHIGGDFKLQGYFLRVYHGKEPVRRTAAGVFETSTPENLKKVENKREREAEIDALIAQLDSVDPQIVLQSIRRLDSLEAHRAVPKIFDILEENIRHFSPYLWMRIREQFDDEHVPPPPKGLAGLDREKVITESLEQVQSGKITTMATAARRLADMGAKEVGHKVFKALWEFPGSTVVSSAACAVSHARGPETRTRLIHLIDMAAEQWAEDWEDNTINAVGFLLMALHLTSGIPHVPDMLRFATDPRLHCQSRRQAIGYVAQRGTPDDLPPLVRILRQGKECEDAAAALAAIGDPNAIPPLLTALAPRKKTLYPLPLYAALALRQLLATHARRKSLVARATRRLEHLYRTTKLPEIRAMALYALEAGQPSQDFLKRVADSLSLQKAKGAHAYLLLTQVWLLGLRPPGFLPLRLVTLLREVHKGDGPSGMAMAATALAIGRIGTPKAFTALTAKPRSRTYLGTLGLLLARKKVDVPGAYDHFRAHVEKPPAPGEWADHDTATTQYQRITKHARKVDLCTPEFWEKAVDDLTIEHFTKGLFWEDWDKWRRRFPFVFDPKVTMEIGCSNDPGGCRPNVWKKADLLMNDGEFTDI